MNPRGLHTAFLRHSRKAKIYTPLVGAFPASLISFWTIVQIVELDEHKNLRCIYAKYI